MFGLLRFLLSSLAFSPTELDIPLGSSYAGEAYERNFFALMRFSNRISSSSYVRPLHSRVGAEVYSYETQENNTRYQISVFSFQLPSDWFSK